MTFHTYILFSKTLNRFYVGHTSNLLKRLNQLNAGESAYTSQGMPCMLIWSATKDSRKQAESLEFKLKNLTRMRKLKFMKKYPEGIHEETLLTQLENQIK